MIPVGAGNRYGHPHRETLALLQGRRVYRTDLHGDIVMRLAIIANRNSKVYHRPDCRSLPNPENQVRFRSAQEAEQAGYRPHTCVYGE